MTLCPLCLNTALEPYVEDNKRSYLKCLNCELISVPGEYLLTDVEEKAEYDQHQNDPDDDGYKQFLSRAFDPLVSRISKNSEGLDFGCGPGPTISVMADTLGIKVSNYDLYYFHDTELLNKKYDFITMTEVIEHVNDAKALLEQLDKILKQKAILAVMTKRVIDKENFRHWHYKNDPTHIRFYSIKTFQWIAENFNWQLEIVNKDVVFFTKL
ncbi:MAG: 2-polyprenyl-3-methyl-5-hydroxy-6-metoxy-1,4-benzoquinol methylase [Enterobacterales bacterium]